MTENLVGSSGACDAKNPAFKRDKSGDENQAVSLARLSTPLGMTDAASSGLKAGLCGPRRSLWQVWVCNDATDRKVVYAVFGDAY
jgi:hypothetical protein